MSQDKVNNIEIKLESLWQPIGSKPEATPAMGRKKVTEQARRVGIATLGCKVNTYESELIGETLKTDDWRVVPAQEEADLYLICLLYTSPSPRDQRGSRMPSSA